MPLITCSALRRVLLDYKTQGGRKYWQKNLIRTNIWTICFNTPKFSNKRTAQFFQVGKRCLIDVAPERIIWQVWAWKPEIFSCRRISIVLCTCQVPRGLPKCCQLFVSVLLLLEGPVLYSPTFWDHTSPTHDVFSAWRANKMG